MPSTLGYALLGLVARHPRVGYELTQLPRAPIGFDWTASHSQVYPEVGDLEAARLIAHRVIDARRPGDTRRYRITATGRRTLTEWAARPATAALNRDELTLKVFSLSAADPTRARAMVAAQREADAALLVRCQDMERTVQSDLPPCWRTRQRPYSVRPQRCAAASRFEAHALAWSDWLLAALTAASQ